MSVLAVISLACPHSNVLFWTLGWRSRLTNGLLDTHVDGEPGSGFSVAGQSFPSVCHSPITTYPCIEAQNLHSGVQISSLRFLPPDRTVNPGAVSAHASHSLPAEWPFEAFHRALLFAAASKKPSESSACSQILSP